MNSMAAIRQRGLSSGAGDGQAGGEPNAAAALAATVDALQDLDASALQRRWRTLVGGDPPRGLVRPLVLRMLAYRLQAERLGDLDKVSRRELDAVHDRSSCPSDCASIAGSAPVPHRTRIARPGTVLMREHGGVQHRVTVRADGFSWNGSTYGSLSQVAFAITGTKWNGPRFFGLRDKISAGAAAVGKGATQATRGVRATAAPSQGAAR